MSIKTNGNNDQHNRYEFFEGGNHTHDFYDPETGLMGSHGENVSSEDKSWSGQRANATMTHGEWTKGVKN